MKASFFLSAVLVLITAAPTVESAEDGGVVLVTGANRGLGLEYARQLQDRGFEVIGTARDPADAADLKATGARVEQLDVTDPDSVAALAERLDGVAIDILINNAGMLRREDSSLDTVDWDLMERTFQVNSLGPLRVIQALLPHLRAGEAKKIVNITSRLGSIELSTGGLYSYRTSKTALNQINRIVSAELGPEGFTCIVMHPGWVRTDMGGPNATLAPEESVSGMLDVIEGLTPDSNGMFFNYDGQELPW